MGTLIIPGRLSEAPRAPAAVQEAVEVWARGSGRHARVEWVPLLACWAVLIDRKAGDPALRMEHEGLINPEMANEGFRDYLLTCSRYEVVPLQEPAGEDQGYTAYGLEELGAEGVVAFLQQRDTWSGRGEYRSLEVSIQATRDRNTAHRERMERDAIQGAREDARDIRSQLLGIARSHGADFTDKRSA